MNDEGWLRTHASLVIRKAPKMSKSVRSSLADWLREQADFVETRADDMGDVYSPRFMHGDEKPFNARTAHRRSVRADENAQRRARNRVKKRRRHSEPAGKSSQ